MHLNEEATQGGNGHAALDDPLGQVLLSGGCLNWIRFDYDNFRNVLVTDAAAGEEPFYSFDAVVVRAFFSFWL